MTETVGPDDLHLREPPLVTIRLKPDAERYKPPPPDEFPHTFELFGGALVLERRQHYAHCGSWFGGVHSRRRRWRWAKTYTGLCIRIEVYEDYGPKRIRMWEGGVGTKVVRNPSREFVVHTVEARVRTLGKLLVGMSSKASRP